VYKFKVNTVVDGFLQEEEVLCDDLCVTEKFVIFERDDLNFLRIAVNTVTRIEYIGEHTE
jgi:hypothetical protein